MIARTSPADRASPRSPPDRWAKLRDHLLARGIVAEMRGVKDLYDHRAADGPSGLRRRPRQLPSTCTRTPGVMQLLAALDLTTGKPLHRIENRRRWIGFLDLLEVG